MTDRDEEVTRRYLPDCIAEGCDDERYVSNGVYCKIHGGYDD